MQKSTTYEQNESNDELKKLCAMAKWDLSNVCKAHSTEENQSL